MIYFCRSKMAEYIGLKLESKQESFRILKKALLPGVESTKTKFEIIPQAGCFSKFQNVHSVELLFFFHSLFGLSHSKKAMEAREHLVQFQVPHNSKRPKIQR